MGSIRLNRDRDGSCIGSAADHKHADEIEALLFSVVFAHWHELPDHLDFFALEIRPHGRFLGRVE